jgi:hypothetical protein
MEARIASTLAQTIFQPLARYIFSVPNWGSSLLVPMLFLAAATCFGGDPAGEALDRSS